MEIPADVLSSAETVVSFALGLAVVYAINRLKVIYAIDGKRALWLVIVVSLLLGTAQALVGEYSFEQPFLPALLKAAPSILSFAMVWYRLVVRD